MVMIIPRGGSSLAEYTVGRSYSVGDTVTQFGTLYKVITAITSAPAAAPYNSLQPLNVGAGNAY